MSEVKLYSYWRSSCSWRVRIALAWKNISYEYIAVNLLQAKQTAPEYTELNPSKLVPTLVIDGQTLNQSPAILEYLEETRPENPLLPKDPVARARVRQIMQIIASDIQPVQNLRVLTKIAELTKDDKQKAEWAKNIITQGFDALEAVLAKTAGKYCYGDSVTLADVCLVPMVYNGYRFNAPMENYPNIVRINNALGELEAFKKANPAVQPDAVN